LIDAEKVFDFFIECIGSERCDEPMTIETLRDPYSPEVCLLLYMYSMEPPFYSDL